MTTRSPSVRALAGRLGHALPFLALPAFALRFVRLPVATKMSYVPDDAFYYMQLGSEFQRSGRWSFDRGRTLTAGFHPLFGYLNAIIERWLVDRSDAALDMRFTVHAALATAATLGALALLTATALRVFPHGVRAEIAKEHAEGAIRRLKAARPTDTVPHSGHTGCAAAHSSSQKSSASSGAPLAKWI